MYIDVVLEWMCDNGVFVDLFKILGFLLNNLCVIDV